MTERAELIGKTSVSKPAYDTWDIRRISDLISEGCPNTVAEEIPRYDDLDIRLIANFTAEGNPNWGVEIKVGDPVRSQ